MLESDEVAENGKGKGKGKGKQKVAAKSNNKKQKVDEIDQPQQPGWPDYILKLIWQDPGWESEGDMLKMLMGMFGLAQYMWHCDVAVECHCSVDRVCGTCVDKMSQLADLEPSTVMGSSGVIPEGVQVTTSSKYASGFSLVCAELISYLSCDGCQG